MRNQEVANEFGKCRAARTKNLHTDGLKIWSYSTVLAEFEDSSRERVYVNYTYYSNTSSHHRTNILRGIPAWSEIIPVRDCPVCIQSLAEFAR